MSTIPELTPAQARERLAHGALLIDIREAHERATGMAEGALGIAKGDLQAEPGTHLPAADREVVLICQSGKRSMQAAVFLAGLGYTRIASVHGGTTAWRADGLPLVQPMQSDAERDFNERYSRHLLLPQVGVEGQTTLLASRVLVLGAGGLGAPASFYLAAAGVGHLRIADDDVVDRSNLHRQIIHTDASVGEPKVLSARLQHGIPLVYGAVERFTGQVSVFDAGRQRGAAPCYRCLFPEPPPPEFAPNCSEAGVLGVLPGMVGLLQATEVLKLLLGIGEPLIGRLLTFDALGMRFRETRLRPDPDCPLCAPGRTFPGYLDYAAFCSA